MSDSKLEQAEFQIFRMTHEGELIWTHRNAPQSWRQGTDDAYPLYFEATFLGRKLALYQKRWKTSAAQRSIAELMGEPVENWIQTAHLALLGDNDEILYEFPRSGQINDLLDAVRYKEARVDEFLNALLTPDATSEKE